MRMTCGASGGSASCRALAAAITSITMNGGAAAARPIFSATAQAAFVAADMISAIAAPAWKPGRMVEPPDQLPPAASPESRGSAAVAQLDSEPGKYRAHEITLARPGSGTRTG